MDGNEEPAIRARLTALIRTKNFEQAVETVKGREKQFNFEHAYILHRQGKNKEALQVLQQSKEQDETRVRHLLSQIVRTHIPWFITYLLAIQTEWLQDHNKHLPRFA